MLVKPAEFGMIQQQNTVSQIRHEEDAKPMAEQQTMVVQSQKEAEIKAEQVVHKDDTDNRQKKFDAKDKSDNEYQSGHKNIGILTLMLRYNQELRKIAEEIWEQ